MAVSQKFTIARMEDGIVANVAIFKKV